MFWCSHSNTDTYFTFLLNIYKYLLWFVCVGGGFLALLLEHLLLILLELKNSKNHHLKRFREKMSVLDRSLGPSMAVI